MDGEDWLEREMAADLENESFEDSERFDEDSDGSCDSIESIKIDRNWSGFDAQSEIYLDGSPNFPPYTPYLCSGRFSSSSNHTLVPHLVRNSPIRRNTENKVTSLYDRACQTCADTLSLEQIEHIYSAIQERKTEGLDPLGIETSPVMHQIPAALFIDIIKWSFPVNVEDIRLYSCLANGSKDEFDQGMVLFQSNCVENAVQIGYLITAVVKNSIGLSDEVLSENNSYEGRRFYNVTLKVDRSRIVDCACPCKKSKTTWCQHIVAVALFRHMRPGEVQYKTTIWDSVNELDHLKLKKFAQFFISELPGKYLPIAQKLLDELKDPCSSINNSPGAPDPTDNIHSEDPRWTFDQKDLHLRIRNALTCFVKPSATPCVVDIHHLTASNMSSVASEFQLIRKPLHAREPEALWNLLGIVRSMMHRRDTNSVSLLRIITEECLAQTQILIWWYITKLLQSNEFEIGTQIAGRSSGSHLSSQFNAARLCDELVVLWKRAALNPTVSPTSREQLLHFFQSVHVVSALRIWNVIKDIPNSDGHANQSTKNTNLLKSVIHVESRAPLSIANAKFGITQFPGFFPALQACCAAQAEISSFSETDIGSTISGLSDWDSSPSVPLQPLPQVTDAAEARRRRKKKRYGHRHNNRGRNYQLVPDDEPRQEVRRNDSTGESGQESENEENQQRLPTQFPQEDVDLVIAAAYNQITPFEMRFSRCEALSTHGYHRKACSLAVELKDSLLKQLSASCQSDGSYVCQPSTSKTFAERDSDLYLPKCQRRVDLLEKAVFLTQVISSYPAKHAFEETLFGFVLDLLLTPKFPMVTKFLQVKEHHLECALLDTFDGLELGHKEIDRLRNAANQILTLDRTYPGYIAPVSLALYIFETLSYSFNVIEHDPNGQPISRVITNRAARRPTDDELALQTALCALGSRLCVTEDYYPMLYESIRQRKGDLAFSLMKRYKDSREKLGLILDRLLDPSVHQMYKNHQSNAAYFLERDCILKKHCKRGQRPIYPYPSDVYSSKRADGEATEHHDSQNAPDSQQAIQQRIAMLSLKQDEQNHILDQSVPSTSSSLVSVTGGRVKRYKNRNMPNQATEANAYFMSELAKRIAVEAGVATNDVFGNVMNGPPQPINRNLHMCGVIIGIYALGLHNKHAISVSSNWRGRTYSAHVSWLNAQILDIGVPAFEVIREVWELHYTPAEGAALADKASNDGDEQLMKEAAKLALSVLSHTPELNTSETDKALLQCKEQGLDMLEKACKAIEEASERENQSIPTDILFKLAHYWEYLHNELTPVVPQPQQQQPLHAIPSPQLMPAQFQPHWGQSPHPMYIPQSSYHQHAIYQQPAHNFVYHQAMPQNIYYPPTTSSVAPVALIPSHSADSSRLHQSHSAPQLSTGIGHGQRLGTDYSRLISAHRLGIRALETTTNYPDDNRCRTKYSQNPKYRNETLWLLEVSKKLGAAYAIAFFECACRSVNSPFVLMELAAESISLKFYQGNGTTYQHCQQARSQRYSTLQNHYHPITAELLRKSFDQFHSVTAAKLNCPRFNDSDREEATNLIKGALRAFQFIPNPMQQKQECDSFLSQMKKQKAAKKDAISVVIRDIQNQLGQLRYQNHLNFNAYPHT